MTSRHAREPTKPGELALLEPAVIRDLLVNVSANIIAALIFGLLAGLAVTVYRARGIKRFFGISGGGSRIKVFLSAIAVEPCGTRGTAAIQEGFHGDAITEIEYRHAVEFVALLRGGSISWIVTTVLGARAGADRILSSIEKSPSFKQNSRTTSGDVEYDLPTISAKLREQDCAVLIGGPIYNLLTHHVLRSRPSDPQRRNQFFEFIRENDTSGRAIRGIRTVAGVAPQDFVRTETAASIQDYFIVTRITLANSKKRVLVCAGTCTAATSAAVDQLINWRQYKRFGDKDFGILYRIHLPPTPYGRETEPDESTAVEKLQEFEL